MATSKSKKIVKTLWDWFVLSLGTLIYTLAWEAFMIPNGVASGGLTGACSILEMGTGFPVSYSFIIGNAVLLVIGSLVLGGGFGIKTIFCIILSSILFKVEALPAFDFIRSLPGHPLYVSEKVLIPIIGGLIEAVGIYFIFIKGGSTGGTDVAALIINKFWPISPGKVYLVSDVFIIASILLVPGKGLSDLIYGYMAMITFSFMLDFMLTGQKSTMQLLVFSEKYEAIADYIIHNMDRGVTAINAMGWYTKNDRKILLIVVRKNQLQLLTKAIKSVDPKAFVSVVQASSVYGEGFEEMKTGIENKKKIRRETGTLNQ
jgi:uncharacterized membrane-anchored protein YitT (DUF2179 family)